MTFYLNQINYFVFFFDSGDHDLTVPYVGTEKWIRSLNLTVKNNWDPWFVGTQVAGFDPYS